MRTVCKRTAFQESSNDLVRISLDTHLRMESELEDNGVQAEWCRNERWVPKCCRGSTLDTIRIKQRDMLLMRISCCIPPLSKV